MLVLLFFCGGPVVGDSRGGPDSCGLAGFPSSVVLMEAPAVTEDPGALRFLDDGGLAGCCGAKGDCWGKLVRGSWEK